MGTNFYFEPDRGGAHFHIGKRSAGWRFTVRRWDEYGIDSFATLAHFLEVTPGTIFDEQGQPFHPIAWYMLERDRSASQQRPTAEDHRYMVADSKRWGASDDRYTRDADGHQVLNCEFF